MKLITLTNWNGNKVAIPLDKITGVIKCENHKNASTFIQTGCDHEESENGFYVTEKWAEVYVMLEVT